MNFNKIEKTHFAFLEKIVGEKYLTNISSEMENYAHDETENLVFYPELVIKPANSKEVSEIVKYANEHNLPVTPRGGGTGLSGGALAVHGGIVLSMERFNKIVFIDERNLQATVEPGVITQVFQEAVKEKGLFYPPDPASKGSCFLGGNLAECAGGPKAVKYGVTKDYILNTEVVLPNGDILMTGANVLKNSTGYNLTQLMIGSEGTLGIVTKIIFRLIPHPQHDLLMLVPFFSAEKACEAVSAVFREGITPSAMEFMERDAIDWVSKHVNVSFVIKENIQAHLLIEVDGNDLDALMKDCEKIASIMERFECDEILFAQTSEEKNNLWKMRRNVAEAVKSHSIYKEEDTVVPRAELPLLLKGVKEIGLRYGFRTVCYGHAGDGNLHVNIVKESISEEDWKNKVPLGIREIFHLCVSLGGTISGEHGIGFVQRPYLDIAFNESQINIMKKIKAAFDPKGIMNPSKIF